MGYSLGEKLRRAREEKGLDLREIGDATRISPHILKAIEEDDYSLLPGGGYSRGFIRSFATIVGLDPAEALRDFERAGAGSSKLQSEGKSPQRKSRVRALIFLTILFAVVSGVGLYVFKSYFKESPVEPPPSSMDLPQESNTGNILEPSERSAEGEGASEVGGDGLQPKLETPTPAVSPPASVNPNDRNGTQSDNGTNGDVDSDPRTD